MRRLEEIRVSLWRLFGPSFVWSQWEEVRWHVVEKNFLKYDPTSTCWSHLLLLLTNQDSVEPQQVEKKRTYFWHNLKFTIHLLYSSQSQGWKKPWLPKDASQSIGPSWKGVHDTLLCNESSFSVSIFHGPPNSCMWTLESLSYDWKAPIHRQYLQYFHHPNTLHHNTLKHLKIKPQSFKRMSFSSGIFS